MAPSLRRAIRQDAEDAAATDAGRAAENGFRAYGPERPPARTYDWADCAEMAG